MDIKIGTFLKNKEIVATQEYKRPPTRYNEASLIDKLDPKNLNIGRPSTYATIIGKIVDRDYVKITDIDGINKDSIVLTLTDQTELNEVKKQITLGSEKKKFVPTSLGLTVNEFLVKEFPKIMDYKFTADMENNLDDIAEGKIKLLDVMNEFYDDFNESIIEVMKKKKTIVDEKSRILGKDPDTGLELIATIGKFTPVVKKQISASKCVFAPITAPLTLETITLEQALKLFEYPKDLGKYKQKQIQLMKGKFGLYIKYGKDMSFPLPEEKGEGEGKKKDISYDEVIELIKEKEPLDKFKSKDRMYIILKGKGDYSNYIKVTSIKKKGKQFCVPLPKNTNIKELTVEKLDNIIKEHYNKSNGKYNKNNKDI
jgi:DNA topoisomerase-1